MSEDVNGSSRGNEWYTPKDLLSFFEGWDDPCLPGRGDGLIREWGDPTYCNPPYSNPLPWIEKAIAEARNGKRVVMLLKHDSSTRWWVKLHQAGAYFAPVMGRLNFCDETGRANFPSVFVFIPSMKGQPEQLDCI